MKTVSVFGLGYVGSVTAACLAKKGSRVIGVEVDPVKIEALNRGHSPIVEAQMDQLVAEAHASGRLSAIANCELAIAESELTFLCVATPSLPSGKLDLSHVAQVSREIGQALRRKTAFHTVVVRSTVLPGTTESLVIPAMEAESGRRSGVDFAVCMNPEFMREGSGVADFLQPTVTVLGAALPDHLNPLRKLYEWAPGRVFETTLQVAEMVKYVFNAYHGLKVSFANEVGTLCTHLGMDPGVVMEIFKADGKLNISGAYLTPGFAFGGSCLPKDLRVLTYRAKELDLHLPLLESILPSNNQHIDRAVQSILDTRKRMIGLLGLSFKPGTDDLRESPAVAIVKRLLGEGCQIRIWDDHVSLGRLIGSNRRFIHEVIPHIGGLLCQDLEQVLTTSEVILIATKAVARQEIAARLRPDQVLIDLASMEAPHQASVVATPAAVATR